MKIIALKCIILGCWLCLGLFACEKIPVEPLETRLGYNYFPTDSGRFVIYDVRETIYSLTTPVETRQYQIRERIAGSFIDIQGETAQRIERFRRSTPNQPWLIDSVWISKRTSQLAIKIESNVPYIKLSFPIQERKTWNGNARNTLGEQLYTMTQINKPLRMSNFNFQRTLNVMQRNDSSLVGLNRQREIYAQGVGLIYKENNAVTYCSTPNCLGRGQISFGNVITQQVNQYGKD